MKSCWKTPNTQFLETEEPQLPIPDISIWINSSLLLSPKAFRILGDMLQGSGEFIPVAIGEEA